MNRADAIPRFRSRLTRHKMRPQEDMDADTIREHLRSPGDRFQPRSDTEALRRLRGTPPWKVGNSPAWNNLARWPDRHHCARRIHLEPPSAQLFVMNCHELFAASTDALARRGALPKPDEHTPTTTSLLHSRYQHLARPGTGVADLPGWLARAGCRHRHGEPESRGSDTRILPLVVITEFRVCARW